MTAELVRGQNHPLPETRLEIRVSAGSPVVAGATLGDEQGTVRDAEWIARPGAHRLPGLEVSRRAAAGHRLAVDLDALPEAAHRVTVFLALPSGDGRPGRFGAVAAPFVAVTGLDGTEIATYTLTGLDTESAVAAIELYRRQGAWKVRAVGQGYAAGLAGMLADQGLTGAAELAASIQEAAASGLAHEVTPPPRTPDGERVRRPAGPVPPAEGARPPVPDHGPAFVPPGDRTPDTAAGEPIDYAHPRRRTSAPPPPVPTPDPSAPGQPARPVAGDATGPHGDPDGVARR